MNRKNIASFFKEVGFVGSATAITYFFSQREILSITLGYVLGLAIDQDDRMSSKLGVFVGPWILLGLRTILLTQIKDTITATMISGGVCAGMIYPIGMYLDKLREQNLQERPQLSYQ